MGENISGQLKLINFNYDFYTEYNKTIIKHVQVKENYITISWQDNVNIDQLN